MQLSCQFAVTAKLDVDFFIERELHKIEWFRYLWREYALVKCKDGSRRRVRMSVSTREWRTIQRHVGWLSLLFFHLYRVCSCTPLRHKSTLNTKPHSQVFFSFLARRTPPATQWTCRDARSQPLLCCPRRSSAAGVALWQCPHEGTQGHQGSGRRKLPFLERGCLAKVLGDGVISRAMSLHRSASMLSKLAPHVRSTRNST